MTELKTRIQNSIISEIRDIYGLDAEQENALTECDTGIPSLTTDEVYDVTLKETDTVYFWIHLLLLKFKLLLQPNISVGYVSVSRLGANSKLISVKVTTRFSLLYLTYLLSGLSGVDFKNVSSVKLNSAH